jgi:hypothetical protein
MNIDKFFFPHPILGKKGNYSEPFDPGSYQFKVGDNGIYTVSFRLNLEKYKTLKDYVINFGTLICEVTCSYTMFRKVFTPVDVKTDQPGVKMLDPFFLEFELHLKDLRNMVELRFLVIANSAIDDFSPDEIEGFYYQDGKQNPPSWKLSKGDVMVFISNNPEPIDSYGDTASDLIKFIKQTDEGVKNIQYLLDMDYIRIAIPHARFETLSSLRGNSYVQDIIISAIVVPALYFILHNFTEYDDAQEKHGSLEWFQFLERKIMECQESDDANISADDIPVIADFILSGSEESLVNSIKALFESETSAEEE